MAQTVYGEVTKSKVTALRPLQFKLDLILELDLPDVKLFGS